MIATVMMRRLHPQRVLATAANTSSTTSAAVRSFCSSLSRNNRISRMLEMGSQPAGTKKNNVRVGNISKNSKVQAVAFDFELLVKAIHEQQRQPTKHQQEEEDENKRYDTTMNTSGGEPAISSPSSSVLKPNVDQVQEVANLLKVDLNDSKHGIGGIRKSRSYKDDDLSALLGNAQDSDDDDDRQNMKKTGRSSSPSSPLEDIRAKYADKLHKRGVEGGLAGVELVKHQRVEALKRGDAEGHWAARKIAVSTSATSNPAAGGTRWMALTGTGKLLSTLTHRSMKIALLPRLSSSSNERNTNSNLQQSQDRTPYERMQDLKRQLKDVVFDVLVDLPETPAGMANNDNEAAAEIMVQTTLQELSIDPRVILFVSDQDIFLRQAKELGMITCRIRPLNARRGNVSSHYTVETVLQVHDVVNELCGISFNTVLNM